MSLSRFIIICVSLVFVAQLEAATFFVPPSKNPAHPGECWYSWQNITWPIGESVTAGDCIQLTCNEDFSISGASCPPKVAKIDKFECKELPMDLTLDYPDCCPKIQCVGEDGRLIVI